MKTLNGEVIKDDTLGLLYLCRYKRPTSGNNAELEIIRAIQFTNPFDALQAYCNIPNPESQLAKGNTKKEFENELTSLHQQIMDLNWLNRLGEYL